MEGQDLFDESQAAAEATKHPGVVSYVAVVGLAMVGGLVDFANKYHAADKTWKRTITEIVLRLFTSGFAGLLLGFGAEALGLGVAATYFVVGVAGFAGVNLLRIAEESIEGALKRIFNRGEPPAPPK